MHNAELGRTDAPRRIMDRLDELVQLFLLVLSERARLLVAAREVNVHVGGHDGWVQQQVQVVCSRCAAGTRSWRAGVGVG